jgi:hypothetical protein
LATAADLADLRAGLYLERVDTMNITGETIARVKQRMVLGQAAFQAEVTADGTYNPWKYYGTYWNGTTWTNAGVN